MSNVLVLVNGPRDCIMANRAHALFPDGAEIVYKERGRVGSLVPTLRRLSGRTRGTIYCIDLGIPAAPLAALRRLTARRLRLVYEIGDPAGPLLAAQGRSPWEVGVARRLDRWLPARADKLVFRGSYLIEQFQRASPRGALPESLWLPDGVDCERFQPRRADATVRALRAAHGLDDCFVVGIVGSIHHNPTHDLVYGWELVEALAHTRDEPRIVGVVVGDGPGRAVLESKRRELGLESRLRLVGAVPHADVATWMSAFDVALSTQTDDPVGWGRTTAKLPEYLACGTAVVCSDVGEAHRWLAATGQTLPYHGFRDGDYPKRLADRLREMMTADLEPSRRHNRDLATRMFDYRVLRGQLTAFLGGAA